MNYELLKKGSTLNKIISVLLAVILVIGLMPSLSAAKGASKAYAGTDNVQDEQAPGNAADTTNAADSGTDQSQVSTDSTTASNEGSQNASDSSNQNSNATDAQNGDSGQTGQSAQSGQAANNDNSRYMINYLANNGSKGSDGQGSIDKFKFNEPQVLNLPDAENTNVKQYGSNGFKLLGWTNDENLSKESSEAAKNVVDELVRSQPKNENGKIKVGTKAEVSSNIKAAEDAAFGTIKSLLKDTADKHGWDISNYDDSYNEETPSLYDYHFYKQGQAVYADTSCNLFAVWIPDMNQYIETATLTTATSTSASNTSSNGVVKVATKILEAGVKVIKKECEELIYMKNDDTVVINGYFYIDEYFFGDREKGVQNWNPVVNHSIRCEGQATIVIKDGVTLTIDAGDSDRAAICCGTDGYYGVKNALTITCGCDDDYSHPEKVPEGTGKIICKGGKDGGAGIGGTKHLTENVYTGHNITIDGGIIEAYGGGNGAGIGGSEAGGASNITINGGDITAVGGDKAAGIGAGDGGRGHAKVDGVTINGGTIHAYGGGSHDDAGGCGIGSSNNHMETKNVKITGGNVYAYGSNRSAGIGCGQGASSGLIDTYTQAYYFYIEGGYIYAEGGDQGSGIGGGRNGSLYYCYLIGGVVDAYGKGGASGIGGGRGRTWDHGGAYGTVTIRGGIINASSSVNSKHQNEKGAGIGGGYQGPASVYLETDSKIPAPTVWAFGEQEGIGFGADCSQSSSENPGVWAKCQNWTIKKGNNYPPSETVSYTKDENIYNKLKGNKYVFINAQDYPTVDYIDENWNRCSHTAIPLKSSDVTLKETLASEGFYYVEEDMEIDHTIVCQGNIKLIIPDGVTLKVSDPNNAGIASESNSSFSLYGQAAQSGNLIAKGTHGAGIGGYSTGSQGNNIRINGCNVDASSTYGCGIGGGESGGVYGIEFHINCRVKATGGPNSAGIGSGESSSAQSIYVCDGYIEAYGGENAAGIGSGPNTNDLPRALVSSLSVDWGTIKAYGGENAAGIGAGKKAYSNYIKFYSGLQYVLAYAGECSLSKEKCPDAIGCGAEGLGPTVRNIYGPYFKDYGYLCLWTGSDEYNLTYQDTSSARFDIYGYSILDWLRNKECAVINHSKECPNEINIGYQQSPAVYGDSFKAGYKISGISDSDFQNCSVHWYKDKERTEEIDGPVNLNYLFTPTYLELYNEGYKFTDVGTYYFDIEYSNQGLTTISNVGTFQISKRPVTVTSGSASKEYDGTALTNSSIEVSGSGWVEHQEPIYTATGSQTEVGSSPNTLSIEYKPESFKDSNYDITENKGTLTVRQISTPLVLSANSSAKTYDGEKLTGQNVGWTLSSGKLLEGDEIKDVVISGEITDTGSVVTHIESYKIVDSAGHDVRSNYASVDVVDGSLTIAPRQVKLMSANKTKEYDGEALVGQTDDITVGGDGFVESETSGISYTMTGSQLTAGSCENSFEYTLSDPIKEQNYVIEQIFGNLTVTACQTEIEVTANSDSKMYDGTELTNPGFSITTGELKSDDTIICDISSSITDAGSCDNVINSYKIMHGTEDVTESYSCVTLNSGQLAVKKRDVVFTSGTDDKIYDGQTLTNNEVEITGSGFVEGQGAQFSVTGAQTNAGTSYNNFTYTLNEGTKADNYSIDCFTGTLTVDKHEVFMYTKSKAVAQSETVKEVTAPGVYTDAEFTTEFSDKLFLSELTDGKVHTDAKATDPGVPVLNAVTYTFKEGFSEDNYTVNKVEGTLLLATDSGPIAGMSYKGVYDGKEHKGDIVVPEGAIVENKQFSVDGGEWQTDVPSIKDVGKKNIKAQADITYEGVTILAAATEYTLEVTTRSVNLMSLSAEKIYDGKPLMMPLVITTGDGFAAGEATAEALGIAIDVKKVGKQVIGTENNILIVGKPSYKESNYDIKKTEGTLTINPVPDTIVVKSKSLKRVYNGAVLQHHVCTYTPGIILPKEEFVAEAGGTQKDVGVSKNSINIGPIVYREVEHVKKPITDNYTFSLDEGTLEVVQRAVIMCSESGAWVYDGETHKNEHAKVLADIPFSGFVLGEGVKEYKNFASITDVGVCRNTYSYTLQANTDAKNYKINQIEGALVVVKNHKPITITADSVSKEYDGEALEISGDGYKVSGSLPDGFKLEVKVSAKEEGASITDAGSLNNDVTYYKITNKDGKDVTDNFAAVKTFSGTLKVVPRAITLTSGSDDKIYDGEELVAHSVSGEERFVSGQGASYQYTGSQTEAGECENEFTYTLNEGTNPDNYNISTNNGKLSVSKRQITMYSKNASKEYDGEPLTAPGVYSDQACTHEFDDSVFLSKLKVGGELKATGSVTEVEQSPATNTIDYIFKDRNDEANFDIIKNEGRLQVTNAEHPGTIETRDYIGIYDGKWHGEAATVSGETGYTVTYSTDNAETFSSQVPKIKDVGSQLVYVKATKGDNEIRGSYVLQVSKKDICLSSASASKQYDGTPLTKDEVAGADGIVDTGVEVHATGSIATVGTATNTIEITGPEGFDINKNYNVAQKEGTLTVTKAALPIIIRAKSATKVYDGAALTEPGFVYNQEALPEGLTMEATTQGTITDAGVADNNIVAYTIKDADRNDVTANFDITTKSGKLVVTKVPIVLQSASAAKVYDATALVKNGTDDVTMVGSFVGEQGIDIIVTGAQTDAGNSPNSFDYSFKTNTNPNNYEIKKIEGRLEVTKRNIILSSETYAKAYDGTPLERPNVYGNDECSIGVDAVFASQVTDLKASTAKEVKEVGDIAKNAISYKGIKGVYKSTNYTIAKCEGYLAVFDPNSTTQKYIAVGRDYDGLYDGATHTASAVLFKAPSVTEELKVWYWQNSSTGWSDTAPSAKNASATVVYVKASVEKPKVDPKEQTTLMTSSANSVPNWNETYDSKYTININKREISLESGSETRVYDKTPLFNKFITPSGDGFVYGEGLILQNIIFETETHHLIDVADTQDASGKYVTGNNKFTIDKAWKEGTDANNYIVNLVPGTLNILPIATPIVITADSYAKKYDGEQVNINTYTYTEGVLLLGDKLSATVEGGNVIDAGNYTTTVNKYRVDSNRPTGTKEITSNYVFDTVDGEVAISKRAVSLTSASDSKTYDGTPLVRNNPTSDMAIAEDGFASRDVPVFNITGSQTKVGSSPNTFSVTLQNGMDINTNYTVTSSEGQLTVTRVNVPVVISIDKVEVKYDGEKHDIPTDHKLTSDNPDDGIVNVNEGVLVLDEYVEVKTDLDSVEDAGEYENNIESVEIKNAKGEVVTENYILADPEDGVYKVAPRQIQATAASAEKTYDGQPLVANDYTLEGDGFAKSQGAKFTVTGSQTEVGSSANTIKYTLNKDTKEKNYEISLTDGTLTVNPNVEPEPEVNANAGGTSGTSDSTLPITVLVVLLSALSAAGVVIAVRRRAAKR